MANPTSTFLDETIAAARGCLALLIGNRQASNWFDFSIRGLVGSLIAMLVTTAFMAFFGAYMLGMPTIAGEATRTLIGSIILVGINAGVTWLLLRKYGRLDGFVPFLVADSWVRAVASIVSMMVIVISGQSEFVTFAVGLAVLVLDVNIGRLIVTLPAGRIAILVIVQLVASVVGLLLLMALGIVAPLPDMAAATAGL